MIQLVERKVRAFALATCAAALLGYAAPASASGLYFSDRGVRPLGRGGAFVAGADDIGAIWYNPAGLADAGSSLLLDMSWLNFTSDFTRRTQVVDSSGTYRVQEYPTVHGTTPVLPLPTIGGSYEFGRNKEWTAALGMMAPYTAVASYPLSVDGQPSPSRYSLVSLDGSALVLTGAWLAYKPVEHVRIGVGVEALVGTFNSTVVFTSSPQDSLIAAAEDPKYDAFSQLKVGPIFAPSGSAGITVIPESHVRIALSGNLPIAVSAPAKVDVRLPQAVFFDEAEQQNNNATVKFNLPAILRAGIEYRTDIPRVGLLRVEAGYVREFWTVHHAIEIIPENIQLRNVKAFPNPFAVSAISIPRNFENSNSYRVGTELAIKAKDYVIDARLGFNYEQSAIPNAYLSPMTVDLNRYTATIGGSFHLNKHWRFDAVYAHVFGADSTVDPAEAKIPRVTPVQGNPTPAEAVNGGKYSARADILGIGMNYRF